jgi:hypothetical protein
MGSWPPPSPYAELPYEERKTRERQAEWRAKNLPNYQKWNEGWDEVIDIFWRPFYAVILIMLIAAAIVGDPTI